MTKKQIVIFSAVLLSCFLGGRYTVSQLTTPEIAVSETKIHSDGNATFGHSAMGKTKVANSERTADIAFNASSTQSKPNGGNNDGTAETQPIIPMEPQYTADEERKMSPSDLGFVGGEVIVVFEPDLQATQRQKIAREISDADGSKYEFIKPNMFILGINEQDRVSDAISKFNRHSGIKHIQKNFVYKPTGGNTTSTPVEANSSVMSVDPRASEQWGLRVVNAEKAWNLLDNLGTYSKTRVVVLDTGMNVGHADILTALNRELSIDVVNGANTPLKQDIQGHGSHVAGIIAATSNNMIGIAGVAAGKKNDIVDLVCVNVFKRYSNGDPSASTADIIRGLYYASTINAKVVNMSLGTDIGDSSYDYAYHTAIKDLFNMGTTIVVAHGNEGMVGISYPAAFSEVISVIALDQFDVSNSINKNPKASYSNYGTTAHISAPGTSILSLSQTGNNYVLMKGTSMASPFVAGVVAMMYSAKPDLTTEEVRKIIADTALELNGKGYDVQTGYGCIDAYEAVKSLTGNILENRTFNIIGNITQYVSADYDGNYGLSLIPEVVNDKYLENIRNRIDFDTTNAPKLKKVSGIVPTGLKIDVKLTDMNGDIDGYPRLSGSTTKTGTYVSSWKMTQRQGNKDVELCTINLTLNIAEISTVAVTELIPKRGITLNGYLYTTTDNTTNIVGTASYKVTPNGSATLTYETEFGKKTLRTKKWNFAYIEGGMESYFTESSRKGEIDAWVCIDGSDDGNIVFDDEATYIDDDKFDNRINIRFSDNSVNVADFAGYYTVGMGNLEIESTGIDAIANGNGHLGLTISSRGALRYSGMLPNGQKISGSTTPIAEQGKLLLPIIRKAGRNDFLSGILTLSDDIIEASGIIWKHTGGIAIDSQEMAFDAIGAKYDKTVNISVLFGEQYSKHEISRALSFFPMSKTDSNYGWTKEFDIVTDFKKKLQLDSTAPKREVTLRFNKNTGIFSGTATPVVNGKTVKAKYQGIYIPANEKIPSGWGFGAYYFKENVTVGGKKISRTLGGAIEIMP